MSLRARSKFVSQTRPAANAVVTLFCDPRSLASHWVRLVLEEKEIDGVRLRRERRDRPSEDLLLLNPELQLPTLADRDVVLHPAKVIVEYLDERFPHPPMMPPDPSRRASLRMVMDRFEHELFPMFEALGEPSDAAAQQLARRCADQLSAVARLFPVRGWFLGMDYSVVDCAWAALLWRWRELGLALPPQAAGLQQYGQRAFERPAFQRSLSMGS